MYHYVCILYDCICFCKYTYIYMIIISFFVLERAFKVLSYAALPRFSKDLFKAPKRTSA